MNWKAVVVGGIVLYIVVRVLGFATGPLIHEGLLKADYQANSEHWRPELNQEPPDLGALMPRWIATGLIWAFVVAGIYSCVRGCFSGPGWKRGLLWGLCLAILNAAVLFTWSGIFDLPDKIFLWWSLEGFLNYLVGCSVMGWVVGMVARET